MNEIISAEQAKERYWLAVDCNGVVHYATVGRVPPDFHAVVVDTLCGIPQSDLFLNLPGMEMCENCQKTIKRFSMVYFDYDKFTWVENPMIICPSCRKQLKLHYCPGYDLPEERWRCT
jgi:hypothetical protein